MTSKAIIGLGALASCIFAETAAADWQKSYVIEWYEPAHYCGAETGIADPGTDCPAGSNPELDYIKVLTDAGYTEQEAEWLRDMPIACQIMVPTRWRFAVRTAPMSILSHGLTLIRA